MASGEEQPVNLGRGARSAHTGCTSSSDEAEERELRKQSAREDICAKSYTNDHPTTGTRLLYHRSIPSEDWNVADWQNPQKRAPPDW